MKRKSLIVILLIVFTAISCNLPKSKEIKFKPEMRLVADKYKKQLEPEIFQTNSGWFRFDTITTHQVIVSIYNAKKLPNSAKDIENLAKNIAFEVYPQIINKEDFSEIDIIFQNKSGTLIKMETKRNYPFTYQEIEKFNNDSLDNKGE